MSSKRSSETNPMPKFAGSFKGNLSSPLHLSRAAASSIEMDLSSDDPTSISSLNEVHVTGVDHVPIATEAYTLPPVTVSVPKKELGSPSVRELEIQPTHMPLATHSPISPSLPDARMQVSELNQNISDSRSALITNAPNTLITGIPSAPMSLTTRSPLPLSLRDAESEQNPSDSGSTLFFPNAHNILITGGSFVNILPAETRERDTKIPVLQKPNTCPLFVGRNDVLDKLRKIFIHGADIKLMSRRSCLLWGTGGIGKTQICLKFMEEMSCRLSHVFWVDASSVESITRSLRGISSIPAAQASSLDDSVETVLRWISGIEEEWLIVFDNADEPPVYVLERFIPSGNRGNILITSHNRSMGRVISFENVIEINEMEEADAITLLLKASNLDASAEHVEIAKNIVAELGCMPLAVDQAGAYIESGKCSIDKFLQQFSLHRQTLMSDTTFRGASNMAVGTYLIKK